MMQIVSSNVVCLFAELISSISTAKMATTEKWMHPNDCSLYKGRIVNTVAHIQASRTRKSIHRFVQVKAGTLTGVEKFVAKKLICEVKTSFSEQRRSFFKQKSGRLK